MASTKLDSAVVEEMEAHAREVYPDECCGLVVATGASGQRLVRIRNVQDEMHARDPERYPRTARTAYAGHPGDLRAALALAEAPGHRLAAFYHSHPDHDAYFSDEDLAQATPFGEPSYPEALQVVVSIYDGTVRDLRAFAWSDAERAYVEAPIDRR